MWVRVWLCASVRGDGGVLEAFGADHGVLEALEGVDEEEKVDGLLARGELALLAQAQHPLEEAAETGLVLLEARPGCRHVLAELLVHHHQDGHHMRNRRLVGIEIGPQKSKSRSANGM